MRRVIGIDTHRTFKEVVFWEQGRLRRAGRVDITRTALEGFGKSLLASDEVVIEATGNCMAVSRVLSPFVKRVVIANPLQVKAIAHAHVKTDKIDAGTLANLYAAGYLPEVWMPDAVTERNRRLNARRYQLVRHRTRVKNEVHAILVKVNSLSPASSRLSATARDFRRHFADERLAPGLDLAARRCVDHVAVVVRDFLVQALRGMGEEIAMLVHGAALDSHVGPQRRQRLFQARRAVDDDQLRPRQSAPHEIVEQRAPGRLALTAHALDRQQHFLVSRCT